MVTTLSRYKRLKGYTILLFNYIEINFYEFEHNNKMAQNLVHEDKNITISRFSTSLSLHILQYLYDGNSWYDFNIGKMHTKLKVLLYLFIRLLNPIYLWWQNALFTSSFPEKTFSVWIISINQFVVWRGNYLSKGIPQI